MSNTKNIILSNIIGINPTGTLDYEGTYKLNGNNNIVINSQNASKESLEKAQKNEINCNSIENFENYMDLQNKINYKFQKKYICISIFFIILIFFIIYLI